MKGSLAIPGCTWILQQTRERRLQKNVGEAQMSKGWNLERGLDEG